MPPKSASVVRRASCAGMPAAIFSSASMSAYARTSSSSRSSTCCLRRRLCERCFRLDQSCITALLRCLQCIGHGGDDLLPLLGFLAELALAGFGEAIKLGAAIVLGLAPEGGEPAGLLQAMQGGEGRAGFDLKCAAGDLVNAARDTEAMQLTRLERLEDEQIKRSLEQVGLAGTHVMFPIELL